MAYCHWDRRYRCNKWLKIKKSKSRRAATAAVPAGRSVRFPIRSDAAKSKSCPSSVSYQSLESTAYAEIYDTGGVPGSAEVSTKSKTVSTSESASTSRELEGHFSGAQEQPTKLLNPRRVYNAWDIIWGSKVGQVGIFL